ncbi:poly-beta-1,6-N-acetyl-D-glucosamine biosynthesis protein PgaD [Pseudomonas saliphila]|uniref:poly-beta-1,6-N-acetyl-D-glucosamine biosynthesis protein PgaD n=1 Tax=Pseudomonas saliphila TaxID=2586906 RepID=UPI00123874B8|nr:poly-beta-1,6-N-acetyl-D-glucosamine biosynthesis protein PgaD [Pseudomonas saliphila]
MTLICTPRHWMPKLIDTAFTLAAWGLLAWLLYIGIAGLLAEQSQGLRIEMDALLLFGLESLLFYLVLSLSIAIVLSTWATFREKRAARFTRRKWVPIMSDEALSNSFRVEHRLLQLVQEQQVQTVHNDEHGHFLSVDMPEVEARYGVSKLPDKPEVVMIAVDNASHAWQTFSATHGAESLVSLPKTDVINGQTRH